MTQFSGVRRVAFLMEGATVPGVGAAWRLVAKPIGRDTFGDILLPPIFVDRPAWGAAYLTGTEITGIANVFEAQFKIELRDAAGNVLDEAPVTASCGTGCWGSFSVRLHYDVKKSQWGELRVFDISEADSTVVGLRIYPVWLRA